MIGLDVVYNWASETSPTLGCSIEIARDIYVSVCMSWYAKVRRQNYMAQKRACSKSNFGRLKPTWETHVIHFDYTLEQLYHGRKRNVRLEMRNVKQAELQRLKNRGKKGWGYDAKMRK